MNAANPKTDKNRPQSDFFPTLDPNVTKVLVRVLSDDLKVLEPFSTVWEPACGEGHMSEVLEDEGFSVHSTTLEDMGYGETMWNFLTEDPPGEFDWIITNPPFSLSVEFINKAFDYQKPFAMLLKSTYWHAANRYDLFMRRAPSHVLPLTWRPNFYPEERQTAAPTMDVSWYIWDGKTSRGYTEFCPLKKPT